jgi:hypothetical protein
LVVSDLAVFSQIQGLYPNRYILQLSCQRMLMIFLRDGRLSSDSLENANVQIYRQHLLLVAAI